MTPARRVRAFLLGDDGWFIVFADGTLERLRVGGHPHGAMNTAPTATTVRP